MSRKLLVIDNHRDAADAIADVARGLDFDVRIVTDSRVAVGEFVCFSPDMVIVDMVMKDLDGVEVLNGLIISGLYALIVLTASAGIGEAYLRIAQGVAHYNGLGRLPVLGKPLDRAELREILSRLPSPS